MAVFLASDLHLSAARPERVEDFVRFAAGPARRASALYLLGDLFDLWLGDDDDRPPHGRVLAALAALTGAGVPVAVMRGNHDFTLGESFARITGARLIEDPTIVELYGERVVLTHGDTLCTDDVDYQAFRARIQHPDTVRDFLARPLEERQEIADDLRRKSGAAVAMKPVEVMDVNPGAAAALAREHGARHLVHGHTHLPDMHPLDGTDAGQRIVLAPWYEESPVLVWDEAGYRLEDSTEL